MALIRDLPASYIIGLSYEDLMELYRRGKNAGTPSSELKEMLEIWEGGQKVSDRKAAEEKAENAARDQLFTLGTAAVAGPTLFGIGNRLGEGVTNSLFNDPAKELTEEGIREIIRAELGGGSTANQATQQSVNSLLNYEPGSMGVNDYNLGSGALDFGGGTSQAVGPQGVPSVPNVTSASVQAQPSLADVLGFGENGITGMQGLGAAGVLAGNIAADKFIQSTDNNALQAGYGALNSLNPIQWGIEGQREIGNVLDGKQISDAAAATLAIPTGGLSLLYNPISGFFGSDKAIERERRDSLRNALVGKDDLAGLYSDKGTVNLADGQSTRTSDWGIPSYQINPEDAGALTRIAQIEPLTYGLFNGLDEDMFKARGQIASELGNASTRGGGDVNANISNYYQNSGTDRNRIAEGIWSAYNSGQFDSDPAGAERKRDALLAQTDLLYAVDNPNASEEDRQRQQSNPLFGTAIK